MKKILLLVIFLPGISSVFAQKRTELFDLVNRLMPDSATYAETGDWAVGVPAKFPVRWKEDRIVMSDDLKINFFRTGKALLNVHGKPVDNNGNGAGWDVMIKGPRSGYTSFNISSPMDKKITAALTPDSLFESKRFKATLIKACDKNPAAGFYYYRFIVPGKATAFLKIGWRCSSLGCMEIIDVYDDWSKQYAELDCR